VNYYKNHSVEAYGLVSAQEAQESYSFAVFSGDENLAFVLWSLSMKQ
jgi:hypothetical protein